MNFNRRKFRFYESFKKKNWELCTWPVPSLEKGGGLQQVVEHKRNCKISPQRRCKEEKVPEFSELP
jgi:hypothetical protein